ncbi:Bug family tripartite tricarboxylate transporter substrate binding protein [Ottowia thiooxydans]|uniref:Bug family tripartite tricarboxylate transporter substrate binding protein n=1 Tax=Ottowia thiooxydans TaxID=219182 RepID=UPI0004141316|nr:tripartite tricarboxylate transporter substrate-binding protein [Ottowia thiooxydans]
MKKSPIALRRRVAVTATLALLAGGVAPLAFAQAYPSKPIKIIAPFPPGGFTDVVTRRVATKLSSELGQPVVVENRPGAGTNIGNDAVAQSAPDGYTLLMGTSSLAINRTLYSKLSYDAEKDLLPLGTFATTGYTLLANNSLPANDVAQLIALAKSKPDTLSFGSSGNGAVNHLAGALFTTMAGVKLQHVPYKGSQAAITDLIGGQIQLFWASNLEAMPMLKAGRVKALGVTTKNPVPVLPGVPPIGQTVKGYEAVYWMGLYAPAKTPPAIAERLGAALQAAAASAEMREALAASGAESAYEPPADARALLARDTQAWGKVVRDTGAKVD